MRVNTGWVVRASVILAIGFVVPRRGAGARARCRRTSPPS